MNLSNLSKAQLLYSYNAEETETFCEIRPLVCLHVLDKRDDALQKNWWKEVLLAFDSRFSQFRFHLNSFGRMASANFAFVALFFPGLGLARYLAR